MNGKTAMPPASTLLIGGVILFAVMAAAVAVWAIRPHGESGSGLPDAFTYRVDEYTTVDPSLLRWRQVLSIPIALKESWNLAVDDKDRAYVVGDSTLLWFNSDGSLTGRIELDAEPRSLAVAGEGREMAGLLYIAFEKHVEVYQPDGTRVASWKPLGGKALLTAIVLGENEAFLADAGRRVVLRYDLQGKILGEIGRRDEERGILGFFIPSPYFALFLGEDGLLRVVNPGRHCIEYYTPEGRLEQPLTWGRAGAGIDGFSGCCNPASIALLSDGRTVTSEKGIPRVKVYAEQGCLDSVVAGPSDLVPPAAAIEETRTEYRLRAPMVAVDSRDRVLVLDPATNSVRIFQEKP